MNWIKVSCLTVILSLFALNCQAEGRKLNYWPYQEFNWSVTSESFLWREYLRDGSELLTESGVRYGLGFKAHNYTRRLKGIVYEVDFRIYGGEVHYDGKSQDGSGNFYNVETDTDYAGGRMLFMGGQRWTKPSIDLLAGLEVNSWIRSLVGATDSAGNYASGYREFYRILAARAGLGSLRVGFSKPIYIQGGLKYPLDIFEFATGESLTLFPRPAPSLFASVDITRMWPSVFTKASLRIFYDSYRFEASPVTNGFYQPESRMDTIGLTFQF